MIKTIKSAALLLLAFIAGFGTNEYFMHSEGGRFEHRLANIPHADLESEQDSGSHAYAAPEVVHTTQQVITTAESNANNHPSQLAAANQTAAPVFSFELIQQLMANSKYEQAIRLLKDYLLTNGRSLQAWYLLAKCYEKSSQPMLAVDTYFRYLKMENDSQRLDSALKDIRNYLWRLKETPALYNDDISWLIAQFEELLKYNANNGELHLTAALLALQLNDNYQAQYHALMAVNDPTTQKRAEAVLAKINGDKIVDEATVPITRIGNQFIINASVEGYPARLLLDTGASISGLSTSYTAKYPFMLKAKKPIQLNTAGGQQNSFLFTVNSISFANAEFEQHILVQLPMEDAQAFDGLLGIDILGHFDFVIDQNASVLRLKPRK